VYIYYIFVTVYPSKVRSFQVAQIANTSISLIWLDPKLLGTLPPIYQIQCISPIEVCQERPSTNRVEESSSLTFTYNDLLPNINYTFSICAHNSMTLSYVDQKRFNVKCQNKNALTKEGCMCLFKYILDELHTF